MSGLCAVARWDGVPVDMPAFERVAALLSHRAIDGRDSWSAADAAVVVTHQHFWTTPEEVGERQPHVLGDVVVALDGRLDNRMEAAQVLGLVAEVAAGMSDAALVAEVYRRRGDDGLTHLRGAFALVVWDAVERRLVALRDPLGRRTLFYRAAPGLLVVASEPGAVRAWPGTADTLDDVFLAHYFALRSAPEGKTLFAAVTELLPGHKLVVSEAGARLERYWSPRLAPIRYRTDDQYGEAFIELLDEAVRQRRRSVGEPGVMMSGGLDSTSVAALATRQLRQDRPNARLKVFSYVFDEFAELDERPWMAPMVAKYDLDQVQVVADNAWPMSDLMDWQWNPSGPDAHAFRPLNKRVYAAARQAGGRVLLTGGVSDSLFLGHESWLADLVADGRWRVALSEVSRYVRTMGPVPVLRSDSVRRLAASLVGRHGRAYPSPPWLTPAAAQQLVVSDDLATEVRPNRRPNRRPADIRRVLDAAIGDDGIDARFTLHRCGIELREPFSALPLVEFTLALPAYALYNLGQTKHVLRQGVAHLLPEEVMKRTRRSDISPLYQYGMREMSATLDSLVGRSDALCRKFVRPEWLSVRGAQLRCPQSGEMVVWKSFSLQWWVERGQLIGQLPGRLNFLQRPESIQLA